MTEPILTRCGRKLLTVVPHKRLLVEDALEIFRSMLACNARQPANGKPGQERLVPKRNREKRVESTKVKKTLVKYRSDTWNVRAGGATALQAENLLESLLRGEGASTFVQSVFMFAGECFFRCRKRVSHSTLKRFVARAVGMKKISPSEQLPSCSPDRCGSGQGSSRPWGTVASQPGKHEKQKQRPTDPLVVLLDSRLQVVFQNKLPPHMAQPMHEIFRFALDARLFSG